MEFCSVSVQSNKTSHLQAEDTRGVGNAEKRDFDCGNDPCCQPWEYVEAESGAEAAPSAFSEPLLPEPQESDCLPSVSLAVFLALVFALVSLFLPSHDKGHLPLHDCLALTSNKAYPRESGSEFLCLLFPNQPASTWQTLQRYVHGQRVGSHPSRAWILAAVELGDARGTLLCLAKATLSLLTDERAVRVQFPEQRKVWVPWMDFLENGTCGTFTAKIYAGRSLIPYGMIVSLQSSSDGRWLATKINLALLLSGSEQARERVLLQPVVSMMVSDILSAVRFADRVPEQLMITDGSLPVLLVRSEQHLEGSFAC